MQTPLLDSDEIMIVYDSHGVKREVLIDYEKFQEIAEFLERHAYFYSEEVQDRLRQSEQDVQAGRFIEVNGDDIDRALDWLHE